VVVCISIMEPQDAFNTIVFLSATCLTMVQE
jgi:hypothetical protein